MKKLLFIPLFLLTQIVVSAQVLPPEERQSTIDTVLKLLNERYVFPDVARKMEQFVRSKRDVYSTITEGNALAAQLTNDFRSIAHDKHLNVGYHPEGIPDEQIWKKEPTSAEREAQRAGMRAGLLHENFGILDVSVLKFNIGYLNFKYLAPPEFAGESYSAAMNYLAKTDALIIDLRQCRGAISEHAIPFLCSYFFAEPTHLNDLYWRDGNITNQSWTYAEVPGHQYLNKPIYVLTSKQTFSGAEELAYDLKNLKRATLLGETTGGGANPGGTQRINAHFEMFLPFGRAINPITHTNWEGVGVEPDSAVSAKLALYKAQLLALRHIIADSTTEPNWRTELTTQLTSLEKNPPVFIRHTFTLKGYPQAKQVALAGSFNNWSQSPLVRKGDSWVGDVDVEPGKVSYKFIVNGQWIIDPANPRTEGDGKYTNSVLEIVR
ncbi:peptidase [Spirosoma sp. HMF4905]|uniref:Peptidase n=1 Tax=Spirosoma arboris TaxID=2682092 RepID=A0A7K1SIC4_9BACT|nr:S41 family peptidase [Spirosoma arboris]MVM33464.1 peptidase [Spirosoma arboris]